MQGPVCRSERTDHEDYAVLQRGHVHEPARPEDAEGGREPRRGGRNRGAPDERGLGPQIGYAKGDFEKAVEGRIPVAVIPMVDYGRMNAAKILDDVKKMLG